MHLLGGVLLGLTRTEPRLHLSKHCIKPGMQWQRRIIFPLTDP